MGETAAVSTSDAVNPSASAEDIHSIRARLNSSQNRLAFKSAQRLLREPIGGAATETQLRYLVALATARAPRKSSRLWCRDKFWSPSRSLRCSPHKRVARLCVIGLVSNLSPWATANRACIYCACPNQ
jgi:hypothetical protein